MRFHPSPWKCPPCSFLFIERESRGQSVALCACRQFGVYQTTEAISYPLWEAHAQSKQQPAQQ